MCGVKYLLVNLGKNNTRNERRLIPALVLLLFFILMPSRAWSVGMVVSLDQTGRTTEVFHSITREIGLSLAIENIPLLRPPSRGPQVETEINYLTGFVKIQTWYVERTLSSPLALEILTFSRLRNEGKVVERWRKNIRLSLGKAQFQKHGAGLQWEIVKVPKSVRAILGEGGVGLQVNGYRKIMFSGTSRWQGGVQNTGSFRQSKFPSLDMTQISRFSIKGNIGSKIYVTVDQDSKRDTDLANRIQIRYKGDEDDVLQTVELGNTTLNLPNTRFVGYSQRIQGLFGVKATAKVGDLGMTFITSQEKGNSEKTRFTVGSGQKTPSFRRDYEYLQRTYYDIGLLGPESRQLLPGDRIINFKLFKKGLAPDTDPYAKLMVNPADSSYYPSEFMITNIREMVDNEDYFLEPDEFWIRLERQHIISNLLACYMLVLRSDGSVDTIGTLRAEDQPKDTMRLKLLKPNTWNTTNPTWNYEWKNVYSLGYGARGLSYEEIEVNIFKGLRGTERETSNLDHQDGVPYLQLFGLDRANNQGVIGSPDDKIDNSAFILDLSRGHIIFPNFTPFAPQPDTGYSPQNPTAKLLDQVPTIYTSSTSGILEDSSKYYLRIMTSRRSSDVSLGKINILDGSETVMMDGVRLTRGVDYNIEYDIGRITFLSDRVLNDPEANLTIDYEHAPLISAERKSLYGGRIEYSSGPDFKIGSSFLFKGQKSTNRQPKLGQERSRSMIGEVDLAFTSTPQWMTKLANAFPLVETSSASTFRLSGEIARSTPNPNTDGQVYVDDFEGTKLSNDLGTIREYWKLCTPPDTTLDDSTRGRLIWYNPYEQFSVTDVYDREVGRSQDLRMKVLYLRLTPHPQAGVTTWGGVMRALPGAWQDQSQAEFLELRLGTEGAIGQAQGLLHIDLGEISEDVDGDGGAPDSEDRDVFDDEGNLIRQRNGILDIDDGEDVGLDGMNDAEEREFYGLTPDDPNYDDPSGDNWDYSENDPENYEKINGTEGNGLRGDRLGYRPDTEDLDGDEFLDQRNNYYRYTIDLANSPYAEGSERIAYRDDGDITFRTYRIPLWELQGEYDGQWLNETEGEPNPTLINYVRLWLDGMDTETKVVLADMNIVENRWRAAQVDPDDSTKIFRAEVIGTEENTNYDPPPGVAGYVNPRTRAREREQSLLLRFENFTPGDTGWAVKTLNRTENYTGYRHLRLFVHGEEDIDYSKDTVSFIFRVGKSANDYYEYRARLTPGWRTDSTNNEVLFDFDVLTPLKQTAAPREVEGGTERLSPDGTYKIRGNPTLTQVKYFAAGVAYHDGESATLAGEVWVDEMRLTDVRKDPGTAARLTVTAGFADLFGFTLSSEHKTYSFRGLAGSRSRFGQGANLLNGNTQTRHDLTTNLSMHKFLPASWRITLPVKIRYSKDVAVPKLLTGSDIVLTPALQKNETTTKINYGVSASERMTLPSKHWLITMTVNALSFNGSMTRGQTWSPRTNRDSEKYNAAAKYQLTMTNLLSIPLFGWTKYFLIPRRISGITLNLLPKTFRASGSVNRSRDLTSNSQGNQILSYNRRFKGQADLSFSPFSNLSGTYGFSTDRDLFDPEVEMIKLSFNPREFRLGRETSFSQKAGLRYTPPLISFLSPSLTYNTDFREIADRKRYPDGTRSAAVSSNIQASGSLALNRLFGGKGGRRGTSGRGRGRARGRGGLELPKQSAPPDSLKESPGESKKEDSGGFKFRPHAPLLWMLRQVTKPLAPIKGNYSHNESRTAYGLLQRPTLAYRFGLSSDLGVPISSGTFSSRDRDNETIGDKYGLNSAVNLFRVLKISTNYDYSRQTSYSTASTRRIARTFPKLSTSLSKLSKIKLLSKLGPLNWIFDNTTAKFDYSHTEAEQWKQIPGLIDTVQTLEWEPQSENQSDRLGTSLRMTRNFKNGLRLSSDYSWTLTQVTKRNIALTNYTDTRKFSRVLGFSVKYSFRAPQGMKFPLLRGLRLKSTLNLNLSIKLTSTLAEKRGAEKEGDQGYYPTDHQTSLSIEPRANYSFSSTMKGGFQMNWKDTKNLLTGRTNHVRQVSLWIEFSF